ncbi:MAG: branched-chain amino acid ABC transporter permease [Actinomycetota bacterium]
MSTAILNGAFVGMIYGIFAVGLVVVYRSTRVVNFAHGEIGMLGAFVFSELWFDNGHPLALALVVGVAVSVGLGAVTEWLVVRPLRDQPRVTLLVATFGLAGLLLVFASRRYGVQPRFIDPIVGGEGPHLLGLTIKPTQLLIVLTAIVVLLGLTLLYNRTSFGVRMRATAIDPYAAGQIGINTNAVSIASWALAGALSGISAILVSSLVVFHVFFMTALLVRGLAAALLGGLTNIHGAFGAGVLLGVSEGVLGYTVSTPGLTELTIAGLIMVVLLVRPTGLLRTEY